MFYNNGVCVYIVIFKKNSVVIKFMFFHPHYEVITESKILFSIPSDVMFKKELTVYVGKRVKVYLSYLAVCLTI